MNARSWNLCGMVIVLVAVSCQTVRASDGRPSRDTLAQMGLGGLVVMSDDDALAVRGMGYKGSSSSVRVFGNSFATINTKNGTAHSENGYVATGKHFAKGSNFSFAGAEFKKSSGKGGHGKPTYGGMKRGGGYGGGRTVVKSVKVFAGGFSSAKAH